MNSSQSVFKNQIYAQLHVWKLPPSFFEMWQNNRERNAMRVLRNADDIYICSPHRIELYKRMPLVSFATAWNSFDDRKYNPRQNAFLNELKTDLLAGLDV